MKPRTTRADVASKAGVSKTTVTYVLGNRQDIAIPEHTRERVRAAAKQLGYRPNATARALTFGRTYSVTLAFPMKIGAHYAHVLQAFEREANAHGYHLIASTLGHLHIESVLPDLLSLIDNLTDGVILVDMPQNFQTYIDEILPGIKPVVSMGLFTVPGTDYVEVNLKPAVTDALHHLLEAHPHRLAFLGPSSESADLGNPDVVYKGDPRPSSYREMMISAGRPIEIIPADPSNRRASLEALKGYIADHGCPDALFCFNDEIAISASRALREMNLRVPEDVLIIGCDGSEESEYTFPPLSTIVQPIDEMCHLAWGFMAERLAAPDAPHQQALVRAEFEIRGSSRRPK